MKNLAIVTYIKENGLEKAISTFNLIYKDYGHKFLLKYNQLSSPTIMAFKETQECRGLILEKDTLNVMSMAFEKFFNHGEGNAAKVDLNSASIFEKLDGSLLNGYFDKFDNKWYAATTGMANGEGEVNNKFGLTFNDLFWKTVSEKYNLTPDMLNPEYCYMFELTTPYNIVVKPHYESSATILSIRDLTSLNEISRNVVIDIGLDLNVPVVKAFDMNIKNIGQLIKTFEGMPFSEEGYVLCDSNFKRIKIKNPAYLAAHHLKNKTSEHAILDIVKSNEIEEFAATFVERKAELIELKENYDKLTLKLNYVWDILKEYKPKNITPNEKKKYALKVFEVCNTMGVKTFTNLFFGLNDSKIASVEEYLINFDNKTLYGLLSKL